MIKILVRPKIHIETEGLESQLRKHLKVRLKETGPLSEQEIWEESLAFFSPNKRGLATKLAKSYKLRFGKKIGVKTADMNLMNHFRLMVSDIKKDLLSTERPVYAGRTRIGRIFYASGQEGKIHTTVRKILTGKSGAQHDLLIGVESGPVKITPGKKRAADMLVHYGLVEIRLMAGKNYAVKLGYNPVEGEFTKSKELFPEHFKIWKPFSIETWVLREGPEKVKLKFHAAAWDPVNRVFLLAMEGDYIGISQLRAFKEKRMTLGLPAKTIVFCKEISDSAKNYAGKWGMEIKIL